MKTRLLYVAGFMLVFFISCSVEDSSNEQLLNEKELKIKDFLDTFSKSVMNSSSYNKYIQDLQIKTSSGSTSEEIQEMEQEFLSQQTQEFIALYNYIVSLNLSEDELRVIIVDYLSNSNQHSSGVKNNSSECSFGDESDGASSILALIIRILCEEASFDTSDN